MDLRYHCENSRRRHTFLYSHFAASHVLSLSTLRYRHPRAIQVWILCRISEYRLGCGIEISKIGERTKIGLPVARSQDQKLPSMLGLMSAITRFLSPDAGRVLPGRRMIQYSAVTHPVNAALTFSASIQPIQTRALPLSACIWRPTTGRSIPHAAR